MTDTIDQLAGLQADHALHAIRHQRAKVALATQACEDLLLGSELPSTLSQAERLVLAAEQARVSGITVLQQLYQQRAQALALPPALRRVLDEHGCTTGDARLDAMRHFVRSLSLEPAQSDRQALLNIPAAGVSVDDTVLLAQLIGFVSYQARVIAGLQAMVAAGSQGEVPVADAAAAPAFVHPANLPAPGEPLRRNGYTSETLDWKSWLPVLDPATATPDQQHTLDVSHPKARTMDFYLLLCRQPQVLLERSQAFNAIMYAPGGLSRAEREVAATAVSRVNGCVYCASVHAQRFEQLAKRNDVMAQIFDDPHTAGTQARERAIIQAAITLTRDPAGLGAAHIQALRAAGLNDLEVLDMLHAAALFGWANRLMLNLGEAVYLNT
ncbi:CMD domain-containing protein [Comamonas kerstersii]|uniref:CMD domain-containing protein n=1 Tax=Comamonas kerstersii TaxID=225992 RepID=UPI001B339081|nr:peroxidase-related enzyme [Comamonas kerstersii]QTW20085.1 peroxidase-related enzyme [Comamonas kerstersii]